MTTYDNKHIPGNINNYECVTEDVRYCWWCHYSNMDLYLLTRSVEF